MPENPMTAGSGNGAGLPSGLNFPHFSPFGGLPLDPSQRSHHGHMWETHTAAAAAARFHALQGLSLSGNGPSLADLSLLTGRREGGFPGGISGVGNTPTPGVTGSAAELHAAAAVAYSRLASPYMDPIYSGLHTSPTASLRLSPIDSRGSTGLGMPPDYMSVAASAGFCPRSLSDLHPSASTLSSAELAYAFDNARFISPRASVNARANRKRALSCSPYSDSFDINSMIRFSPTSLVSLVNGSRGSSAASHGSFGHLSASGGTMSPALGMGGMGGSFCGGMPPLQQLQAHLLRSGPLAGSLPGSPFLHHAGLYNNPFAAHQSLYMPSFQHSLNIKQEGESAPKSSPGVGAVSSTMEVDEHIRSSHRRINKARREPVTTTCGANGDDKGEGDKDEIDDFIETNCHWTGCSMEFCTQEELVTHINTDHIHANKKVFICRWKECSREEKPFKAQYMLVVHMRRHTGEKPHRCTFEGCLKAYSRLENLKTHLRSHTGEKPYTCEYPGCIKAFSNASDRAKHQNRTHSNEKPYVCKAPGCIKRYTDPSSLRKHVKTVHGADFYNSKKHKGNDHSNSHEDRNGKRGHNGNAESPRSEDMGSKTTSVSSPSIKSEDPNSPHQQSSPGGDSSSGTEINGREPMEEPISDNNVSTTNEMSDAGSAYDNSPMMMQQQQQNCWDLKEEQEIIMPEMMMMGMQMAVGGGGGSAHPDDYYGGGGINNGFGDSRRFRGRMGAKGFGGPMIDTHGPRRNLGIENLNRRITDLKMEGPPSSNPQMSNLASFQKPQQGSDLTPRLPHSHMTQTTLKTPQEQNSTTRRDSGNSTLSSYYSSMRSDGGQNSSRRSSALSQTSNQNAVPNAMNNNRQLVNASPYDPISPGSSRRSSAVSDTQTEHNPINSLASSSNTLTSSHQAQAHLEKLYRQAVGPADKDQGSQNTLTSSGNYLIQSQNAAARMDASFVGGMNMMMMRTSTNASGEMRRMSDPCTSLSGGGPNRMQMSQGMNFVTPTQLTQALQRHQQHPGNNNGYPQNNVQQVPQPTQQNLLSSGEEILIPDDMANFLMNQDQRFGYPSNQDPTRPSTCPPPNSGYPVPLPQNQNLPPPPSYNQAINGNSCGSFNQNGATMQQQPHPQQPQRRHPNHPPVVNNYPNMCSPATPAACNYAAVSSPYNQPVSSPAYSQHSNSTSNMNIMSPKPHSVISPSMPPSPMQNVNLKAMQQQANTNTSPFTHPASYSYNQQNNAYPQQIQQGVAQGYPQNQQGYYPQNGFVAQAQQANNYQQVPQQNYGANNTSYQNPGQVNFPQNFPNSYNNPQNSQQSQNFVRPAPVNTINYNNACRPTPQAQAQSQQSCNFQEGGGTNPQWNPNSGRFYNPTSNPWPASNTNNPNGRYYPNAPQPPQVPALPPPPPGPPNNNNRRVRAGNPEIQCKSVTSQSQASKMQQQQQQMTMTTNGSTTTQQQTPGGTTPPVQGMRPEAYQRTLEYVQQQQLWVSKETTTATTGTSNDSSKPLSPDSTVQDPAMNTNVGQHAIQLH